LPVSPLFPTVILTCPHPLMVFRSKPAKSLRSAPAASKATALTNLPLLLTFAGTSCEVLAFGDRLEKYRDVLDDTALTSETDARASRRMQI
jgi:hypothetical protein